MSQAQPEFVNANVDDILEEQQEQHVEEQQERAKQGSLRRKIEQRRADKTIHLRVEGAKVPFAPPGGEVDKAQDMVADFAGKDEENLTEEEIRRAHEYRDRIPQILGEKCKVPELTAAWWQQTFAPEEREVYLGKLARGGEEGIDADGFRSK